MIRLGGSSGDTHTLPHPTMPFVIVGVRGEEGLLTPDEARRMATALIIDAAQAERLAQRIAEEHA